MNDFVLLPGDPATVAIVGLGYVGLPLAAAFGRKGRVIGFDIDEQRIARLLRADDATGELSAAEMQATSIDYTTRPEELRQADVIIVTVPTPIDGNNNPDLRPLIGASTTIGRHLRAGTVVVYESTVYPGVTEEVCAPILARESGLRCGIDFKIAYSPERINPGDKDHPLEKIVKVVSGMDQETLELVAALYETIITAGVHRASSIKVAEAAKVIENTQRDLNIALVNELAVIFNKLDISTGDVLAAAGTKWNFLPFVPGLVGGHCIGVDPYYLTFKAEQIGYNPQVILAGRRINDGMGKYIAEHTVKQMIRQGKVVKGARVLLLGLSFKENVPDIRNTRVIDIINELRSYDVEVVVHDPLADAAEVQREYDLPLCDLAEVGVVDAVVYAVAHRAYARLTIDDLAARCRRNGQSGVLVDVKNVFTPAQAEAAGLSYWAL